MSDQYAVCRPPGCRLRLDVGSSKASWRQPTCWIGAGYNSAHTAWRDTMPFGVQADPDFRVRLFFSASLQLYQL